MPKVISKKSNIPDGSLRQPYPPRSRKASNSEYPLINTNQPKKRGRPSKKAPAYPPPPPPPPPPADNPYYQKFFEDYWKKYSQGTQVPGGPPPPPPPVGEPLAMAPPMVYPPAPNPRVAAPSASPASNNSHPQGEYPVKTDRVTFVLATPDDPNYLSEKQCYVRTRLCEVFLSEQIDVERSVRSRRAAFVGQVGLRCVFCVPSMPSKDRADRAICYPTTTAKFYQTVQDMQHFHFGSCAAIPPRVKECYLNLSSNMNKRRGDDKISPKEFWAKCCVDLGMVDHIGDDGNNAGVKLKEGHKLVPRARLPSYAEVLFMAPGKSKEVEGETGAGEGAMAQVLAKEVKFDENNGGFDELVADLDGKGGDHEKNDNNGTSIDDVEQEMGNINDDQEDVEIKSGDEDDVEVKNDSKEGMEGESNADQDEDMEGENSDDQENGEGEKSHDQEEMESENSTKQEDGDEAVIMG